MAKKIGTKKALTQTAYFDEILDVLVKDFEYEDDDFERSDIKDCLTAAAQVSIKHASDKNGSIVFGIGKLRLHKKKETKNRMGRNPSTGEEMKLKGKPSMYVPKFRINKACKDGCEETTGPINKELAKKFKMKKKANKAKKANKKKK